MWLYTIAFPIAILIIVGSIVAGGAYTLIGIPVVVFALLMGLLLRVLGRAAARRDTAHEDTGVVTPGELADARRAQQ